MSKADLTATESLLGDNAVIYWQAVFVSNYVSFKGVFGTSMTYPAVDLLWTVVKWLIWIGTTGIHACIQVKKKIYSLVSEDMMDKKEQI